MKEKVAEILLTIQGFRKFLMCLAVLTVSIIFRAKGMVSGGEWTDLSKAIVVSFCATNGLEGITECVKQHLAARRAAGSVLTPTQDPTPEDDEVELVPTSGASQ